MQPLEKMAAQIKAYRDAWDSPESKPLSDVVDERRSRAYTLVHCAESMAQAEDERHLGVGHLVVPNLAEFTLEWEFPNITQEERDAAVPAAEAARSTATSPSRTSTTAT